MSRAQIEATAGDEAVASTTAEVAARPVGPGGPSWAIRATGLACAVLAAACVAIIGWEPGRGIDPTDEASYLQAVQTTTRTDAFNGFFGLYLRPLWVVTGWNIAAVRLVALALLVATAVLLGLAVARSLGESRAVVTATTVAAATGYYATSWRTPAYTWLALVGAGLALTGVLRLRAGSPRAWGYLVGCGVAVAATGKLPTAGLLALLAAAALRHHRAALVRAAAVVAGALLVHMLVVLSPADTVAVVRRSAAVLTAVSATSYSPAGAVYTTVLSVVFAVAVAALGGGLFGLLTLAAVRPRPGQWRWYRGLTMAALVVAGAMALATRTWAGGLSTFMGAGALPVVIAMVSAMWVGVRAGLVERGAARRATGACVLGVGTMLAVLFGSNLAINWQFVVAGLLLAPACLLACAAFPATLRLPALLTVALVLSAGSVVVALESRLDVRRSAPWSASTVPVALGRVTVRTDAATAADLARLTQAALGAGWRPGTRLVDVTFTPAVPLVLGATVPPVLLPGFPGYDMASVCASVRGEDAGWRDAWVLLPLHIRPEPARSIAGYLGRTFPDDYTFVATFEPPYSNLHGQLWRPKPPTGTPDSLGCLAGGPGR